MTYEAVRIDSNELGVDDVAIAPVEMFRLERMDNNTFWACTYTPDGKTRHTFWIRSRSKITVAHSVEDITPPPKEE